MTFVTGDIVRFSVDNGYYLVDWSGVYQSVRWADWTITREPGSNRLWMLYNGNLEKVGHISE